MTTPSSFKVTGGFDASNQKLTNLADATNPQDALNLRSLTAKNTVQTYDPTRTYPVDYVVEYSGQLWKCVTIATGTFDKIKWVAIKGTENWIRITGAYTATSVDSLLVDTTSAPISITLPATPKSGEYVTIVDSGNADINNITVVRNGSTIAGQSADLVLNESAIQVTLVYLGGTWILNIQRQKRVEFISGTATAESNTVYAMLISSAFSVTLPQAPRTGDWVTLFDRNGNAGIYPTTINGGAKQIDGSATFTFDLKKGAYQFIYNGTGWVSFLLAGNALQADKNLTDIADAAIARTALGLGTAATQVMGTGVGQIRTNAQNDTVYQPLDQTLNAIAALVTAADKIIYATGIDTFAQTDFPSQARSFLAATTQALQRTALGLGTAATATVGTASGNVMAVGAFGIGANDLPGPNVVDLNTLLTTGITYISSSSTNLPVVESGFLFVSGAVVASNRVTQTYRTVTTGKVFERRLNVTWSAWIEVLTTANTGSAALANVGTAAGNVMAVGAGGLLAGTLAAQTLDVNTLATTQLLYVNSAATNIPSATFGHLFHIQFGDLTWACQRYFTVTGIEWVRYKIASAWGSWSQVLTQAQTFPAWTNVTYVNSWLDFSATYNSAGYRKEGNRVWLRGVMKNATTNAASPFTLPSGFRPLKAKLFITQGINITVDTTGIVTLSAYTANVSLTLDGLSFEID
ncbi:hypothetical protein D3C80_131880 [compost metagenome]